MTEADYQAYMRIVCLHARNMVVRRLRIMERLAELRSDDVVLAEQYRRLVGCRE